MPVGKGNGGRERPGKIHLFYSNLCKIDPWQNTANSCQMIYTNEISAGGALICLHLFKSKQTAN